VVDLAGFGDDNGGARGCRYHAEGVLATNLLPPRTLF
jgi:hypothetical protein